MSEKILATRDSVTIAVSTHNMDATAHLAIRSSITSTVSTHNADNTAHPTLVSSVGSTMDSKISAHNLDAQSHPAIYEYVDTNVDNLNLALNNHNGSNTAHTYIQSKIGQDISVHNESATAHPSVLASLAALSATDLTKVNVNQTVQQSISGGPKVQHLDFATVPTTATMIEGRIQWNSTDGTLDLGMNGGEIKQQIGQELFVKVINKSGALIANGSPVYFDGRQGNRPKIKLAKGDSDTTACVMGLTTQDIADNDEGFITTFGYVRQIKTNYAGWTEGDTLWLSKDTAGALTNVEPSAPNHSDVVGTISIVGAAGIGSIFVNIKHHITLNELSDVNGTPLISSGQFPVWDQTRQVFDFNYNIETGKDPTGFLDRTSTTLSFVTSALQFSVTPTSGTFDYYRYGKKITKTGVQSVTIPDVTALYFVYFDATDNLVASTTPWDFNNGKIFVALLSWNTAIDKYIIHEERHGLSMTWATHEYLHNTVGTQYKDGLAGTFDNTTFSIESGTIYDEDIKNDISTQTTSRVFYKNGTSTFNWTDPQSTYYYTSGDSLYYNNGNTLEAVPANMYTAVYIFATNAIDYPIITVIGQRTDITLANARTNNTYQSLSLGTLPFAEYKVLFRVLLRNDATPFEEIQDLRNISNVPAGTYVATDHGTLTGLNDDDHPIYALVDGTRAFTGNISAANLSGINTGDQDLSLYVPLTTYLNKKVIIDGDLTRLFEITNVKKIPYLDQGNGIVITSIIVQSSTAAPVTELNANIMYCDAQDVGAFPGSNTNLVQIIDTTTGNFSWSGTSNILPTKELYLLIDADPVDLYQTWTITISYTVL